jgi:hypothetical protein
MKVYSICSSIYMFVPAVVILYRAEPKCGVKYALPPCPMFAKPRVLQVLAIHKQNSTCEKKLTSANIDPSLGR